MKRQLIRLTVLFCLLLGISPISQAQSNPNCFVKAAKKIKPGMKVTLIKQDATQIAGQLQSIDTVGSVLHLSQFTQTDSQTYSYPISDIAKIKFKKPGKFRPEYSVLGLLVGVVVGGAIAGIGMSIGKSLGGERSDQNEVVKGVAVGGGIGLIFGTGIGFMVNSTRTIECK